MLNTADAVIIGGRAIGTSLLYHLTAKGLRNVVLLEKGLLCSGSTGDSARLYGSTTPTTSVSILLGRVSKSSSTTSEKGRNSGAFF